MYKYKKNFLVVICIAYIFLTIFELIKYLGTDSNLYGLIYLFMSLIIIFFLVTIAYNYKRYYSLPRISKLILVFLIGMFASFLLNIVLVNNMSYVDDSNVMIEKITFIRNILKPAIYIFVALFTILETKLIKLKK